MASELTKRVAVALILIPLVGVAAYLGDWVLAIALALFAAGAANELCRIARATGAEPFDTAAGVASAGVVLIAAAMLDPAVASHQWALVITLLTLGSLGAAIFRRGPTRRPLAAVGTTVLAPILCGIPLAHAYFLRHMLPDGVEDWMRVPPSTRHIFDTAMANNADLSAWMGMAILGFPLLVTWVNDSIAYFAGRRFGRRKLIPSVSPGKTVEGAWAGTLASILAGALLGGLLLGDYFDLPISWLGGAIGGLLVSVAAQIGDLAESLLKREAGVKDSGTIFPGHGGILDRLDALFFAFPVGYWALLVAFGS